MVNRLLRVRWKGALRACSEEGGPKLKLEENTLYEVVKYEQDKDHRAFHPSKYHLRTESS